MSEKLSVMPREGGEFQAGLYIDLGKYHCQIAEVYRLSAAQELAKRNNAYFVLLDAVKFAIDYMLTINAADDDSPAIKQLRAALKLVDGEG